MACISPAICKVKISACWITVVFDLRVKNFAVLVFFSEKLIAVHDRHLPYH